MRAEPARRAAPVLPSDVFRGHARAYRQQIDDLAGNLRAVEERRRACRSNWLRYGSNVTAPSTWPFSNALGCSFDSRCTTLTSLACMPLSASARLSTKAPSAPLSTATDLPLRSCIVRMPARPTTASAPCETSDHQDDVRLQPIRGQSEQLIQADDHAVDRLVAESAQHFAGRRILDELHDAGIEMAELAREVERLAADPHVGADAQRGLGLAHAAGERRRHAARKHRPASARHFARSDESSFIAHARPGRRCSLRCGRSG